MSIKNYIKQAFSKIMSKIILTLKISSMIPIQPFEPDIAKPNKRLCPRITIKVNKIYIWL